MSNPFIGEIRMFGGNFAPMGWMLCNGQLLSISQYTALFSLLGTFYGGNGTQNFALPNLQARSPLGMGNGAGLTPRIEGQIGGEQAVTLLTNELPVHNHNANCDSGMGDQYGPVQNYWATDAGGNDEYGPSGPNAMSPGAIGPSGGNQSHPNLQPYLVLTFIIALQGIFPSRS